MDWSVSKMQPEQELTVNYEENCELVVVMANSGYSNVILNAAKRAGATLRKSCKW